MVKITNGIGVYEVTRGAYDGIYSHQGFQIVGEEDKPFMEEDVKDSRTAEEIFVEEIGKKPISQWSKDEVKHYAAAKGIDLSGTKSVSEAKDVIKAEMNKEL